ncbi:MAG TPA: Gfo/Idh/MocA family oxidoreductase [Candidatus Eisenbacteria bacterium]|nr:Gfo/Idh/MocA family oxidoreductase [Candidatus Eisenbacteria bacterium]
MPFRVAVLGTSFARLVQIPAFGRHPDFEVVAIAGGQPEKTANIAAELGIPQAFGDWRELLRDVPVDLVSVVTPVDLHHPMAMAALEAGAHVLCEKPTALHRFQAAEIRDRAASLGRVAAINHEFRFQPARRRALELVKDGAIGTPRRGEILGRYAIWARPESRGMTWLSDAARGGGILGALGSHHTDCLRTFLGEPSTALASVRVDQPRRGPVAGQPVAATASADDAVTVHYEFAGGATAIVDLEACVPYRWERFEIHGTEASLRWDETGERLWRLAVGHEPEAVEIPERLRLARAEGEPALLAPFGVLLDRLARALKGEERMAPDFDDAVAVQCALDAVRESGAAGGRVHIAIPERATERVTAEAAG